MPQITLRNTVDCWVGTSRPAKFGDTKLFVHTTAQSFLYFSKPKMPAGSIITSAVLRLYPEASSGTSSTTIDLHRAASTFDPSTMTWANKPGAGTLVQSLTRSWYNGGAPIQFNVTSEMQAIIDGTAWYGWRVSSSSSDPSQYFNGGQSVKPMELVIDYQYAPGTPTQLNPTGNAVVNDPKPTLSWIAPSGLTSEQLSIMIQTASDSAFTTGVYTSNEIMTQATSYDLDNVSPTFTALTNNQSRYWRVRIKNTQNIWGSYSAPAQFQYKTPAALAMTAPSGSSTTDPTPTIAWSLTGVTQVAYQVFVQGPRQQLDGLTVQLFDSGIQYGTANSYTLPLGVILYPGSVYLIIVRTWNSNQVVSVTGSPSYDEVFKSVTWSPSGATPSVELTIDAEVAPLPARKVRWRYTGSTPADRFIVTRLRNGEVQQGWDFTAASVREGATQYYSFVDRIPQGRADVEYIVMTRWADGQTSDWVVSPRVTVKMDHKIPWILSVNAPTTRGFCLVNYAIDPGLSELSTVVEPIDGPAFLAIQGFKKYKGSASGQIANEAVQGNANFTAEKMKAHFLWLRQNPEVFMVWQDEAIRAFIYNTTLEPVGTADGKTAYNVSFNFVQV